jgi:uncharacterized protein
MVHSFNHKYNHKDYYFLWDTESGSLHSVDFVAFLCAKKRYGGELSSEEQRSLESAPLNELVDIENYFDELEQEGALNAPPMLTEFKKNPVITKALCLNICHDCNMRCSYCFASGGSYNTARDYMSAEVAKKAVDFLIENSGRRKSLEIDFFGGEPLLNIDVVKETVEYAKKRAAERGKEFSFTLTTNCVLLDEETIDYLNKEMYNVVLSIDGRKKTHDSVRKSLDGISYEEIAENIKKFAAARGNKSYYVRGTFTARNLDFAEDILALNDMGFDQISVEPVVLPESSPLAIKHGHIADIKDEYSRFANIYLDRRQTEKRFNFFHFMVDLDCGPCINKRLTGCGAGTEYLSVSPTGEIYPCHQFVGKREFVLGNVFDGINRQDIRENFSDISIMSKPKCLECFAKYYCGGGCAANAQNMCGKLDATYDIGCELTKKRFELSLAIAGIEKILEGERNKVSV